VGRVGGPQLDLDLVAGREVLVGEQQVQPSGARGRRLPLRLRVGQVVRRPGDLASQSGSGEGAGVAGWPGKSRTSGGTSYPGILPSRPSLRPRRSWLTSTAAARAHPGRGIMATTPAALSRQGWWGADGQLYWMYHQSWGWLVGML
jgi:hypothetical protein